jgi:serine/threonine protein kinase
MPPVTNQMLNSRREENCISITPERKYYKVGQTWVKRSLRPTEWQTNPFTGTLVIPRFGKERLRNEAASMAFIAEHTNIPIPKLHCCFEDDEAVYLIMEYIEGVGMNELEEEKRKFVEKELEVYLEVLKEMKSKFWGGPSGIVCCLC